MGKQAASKSAQAEAHARRNLPVDDMTSVVHSAGELPMGATDELTKQYRIAHDRLTSAWKRGVIDDARRDELHTELHAAYRWASFGARVREVIAQRALDALNEVERRDLLSA